MITGSTGGIGSEIAERLAMRGEPLVLVNRSKSKAAVQKANLLGLRPSLKLELVTADLLDVEQVADAASAIQSL
ncbi:MAG: SDR family NAD(P)-dependent oxidoreductase, partial [Planctomycetota bacterium]